MIRFLKMFWGVIRFLKIFWGVISFLKIFWSVIRFLKIFCSVCAKNELSAEPFAGAEITWLRWQEYWFCFANMYIEPDFEVCAQCRQMNGWRMGGRRVGASCGEAATCNRSSTHLLKIFPKIFPHPPASIPPDIPTLVCCKYCPKYSPTHLLQILPPESPPPTCCKYCPQYSSNHLQQILRQIYLHPPAANIAPDIRPPTCCKVEEICQTLFFANAFCMDTWTGPPGFYWEWVYLVLNLK